MITDEDKFLLKVCKKIYPKDFQSDNAAYERGRMFKFIELKDCRVISLQKDKNIFAKFQIRLIYQDKLKNSRQPKAKEWVTCHETNPYIDLPVLTIIKRGLITKDVSDVINGMTNVFKANVLLVSEFKYSDFDRPPLKTMFKLHGIALIYEDEI
jgi:hypothetical protein